MDKSKFSLIFLLALALMLGLSSVAYAHGVVINYTVNEETGELEFEAMFDNGEVLANAQVTIYAPDDPATPWLTAKADENGRFAFAPDQVGRWDVQFRVAGHGDIIHINIEEIFEPVELEAAAEAESVAEGAADNSEVEASVSETEEAAMNVAEIEADTEPDTEAETAAESQADEAVAVAHTDHSNTEKTADVEPINGDSAEERQVAEAGETAAEQAAVETEEATSPRIVVSSASGSSSTGGFTVTQILLMSVSVIWGFVGTALYFQSKRTT